MTAIGNIPKEVHKIWTDEIAKRLGVGKKEKLKIKKRK